MAKFTPAEFEFAGGDSLRNAVTNIVGILILLIMIVGQQARRATVAPQRTAAEQAELSAAQQNAKAIEGDVHRIAAEIESVQQETASRYRERAQLGALIQAANIELARRRDALDALSRARDDLARDLALSRAKLEQLDKLRSRVDQEQPRTVTVESYPTPISKTVDGKEAHFQLKGGRIVSIPLDALLTKFKSVARDKAMQLKDQPELVESIGPIDGFRLRYTLARVDVPFEPVAGGGSGGSFVKLVRWELLPVPGQLGETLDTALSARSLFRARLDVLKPGDCTVTIWTYPDSFEEFRRLRKELYHMGYTIAGRPLPEGTPIGGSPDGSKSAAE
jgi:hypothetical protein